MDHSVSVEVFDVLERILDEYRGCSWIFVIKSPSRVVYFFLDKLMDHSGYSIDYLPYIKTHSQKIILNRLDSRAIPYPSIISNCTMGYRLAGHQLI